VLVRPAAQTNFVIDKIEGALQSFGASLKNVVRTRVYVKNIVRIWKRWPGSTVGAFGGILPANTLVGADLIGSEYLVEIEAEALL